MGGGWCVFFLKQKTAYEVKYGLVGWEMCIRDGLEPLLGENRQRDRGLLGREFQRLFRVVPKSQMNPVSYTHLTLPTSDLV